MVSHGVHFISCAGKDITQKLYSLNEQLGSMLLLSTASKPSNTTDHWRHVMTRSLSVDAVDTGTKGNVRSSVWRQGQQNRRDSLVFSDGKSSLNFMKSTQKGYSVSNELSGILQRVFVNS